MHLRGAVSNKQELILALEKVFSKATSEVDFYKRLESERIELYTRNNKIVGIKLGRKFRFKTLGYHQNVLRELDNSITQNKRLNMLKSIREHQQNRDKEKSKGRERTRKRKR